MSPNGDSQLSDRRFTDFAARLIQCSENAGFNSTRLAQAVGVGRATMARYWSGERIAPTELVFQISDILRISPRWLVLGEADPEQSEVDNAEAHDREKRLIDAFQHLTIDQQEHLITSAHLMGSRKTLHSPRASYRAPEQRSIDED